MAELKGLSQKASDTFLLSHLGRLGFQKDDTRREMFHVGPVGLRIVCRPLLGSSAFMLLEGVRALADAINAAPECALSGSEIRVASHKALYEKGKRVGTPGEFRYERKRSCLFLLQSCTKR